MRNARRSPAEVFDRFLRRLAESRFDAQLGGAARALRQRRARAGRTDLRPSERQVMHLLQLAWDGQALLEDARDAIARELVGS